MKTANATEPAVSESKCQRFLALTSDVFLETDASGVIRLASPSVQTLAGYQPGELLGQPLDQLFAHTRESRQFKRQLKKHQEVADMEIAVRGKDGNVVPCRVTCRAFAQDSNEFLSLLLHKITEPEQVQRALRESEERYRNLIELAPDSIVVLDSRGRLIACNQAACELSGYTLEAMLGKPFWELGIFRLAQIPQYTKLFFSLLRGLPLPTVDVDFYSQDASLHILESRAKLIRCGHRIIGVQIISRDITDRKRAEQAIQRAKERLRTILEASGIGWWYLDLNTGEFQIDQRCRELVNLRSASEPTPAALFSQIVDEDRPAIEQTYADARIRSGLYAVECRVQGDNGQVRWLLVKGRATHEPHLGQQRIEGIVMDITDQKAAEEALRASEVKFRSVFENALDTMFLTKADGSIAIANPAACAMFGMTEQELIEAGRDRLLDTSDPAFAAGLERRRHDGIVNAELTGIRKNGSRFRAEVSSVLLPEQPPRAFAVIRDITERKRAEEALRESEAHCRLLIETIPALAWQASADGRAVTCNRRWYEYTGQTYEQSQAGGWLSVIHPDDRPYTIDTALNALRQCVPYEVEYRLRRASDHTYRWHLARAVPVLGNDGTIASWIGSATDIEDLKQAQEVLKRDHDMQLERLRAELAHVGRLSIMGELAAGLVHELNQPLHAITNYARGGVVRLQKHATKDEALLTVLTQVGEETRRAAEIVRQVRRFIEKRDPQFTPVSINKLIDEVLRLQDVSQGDYHVNIVQELSEDVPLVLGDSIQIQQVMLNLIRNGAEAMEQTLEESRILTLATRCVSSEVQIDVSDRGPGITDEACAMVFEPFFTTKPAGLGMGLAICRSIAAAHGGRLEVMRNQFGGATFRFTLPVTHENEL